MNAESSWGFTEIKQVSACSIQVCPGINGDQCLKHFCTKGRISLHCEPIFHAEKTDCSNKPKCMFSFSVANYL